MDEIQKRGGKLIYDPELRVYRRPRASLRAFARMLLTYGRGRAEQFRVHPTLGSALNFVPPLFCPYLLSLASLPWSGKIVLVPLALYTLAVIAQALRLPPGRIGRRLAVIPLILLTHVLYGAGFWRGLFTRLAPPGHRTAAEVHLERLSPI